MKAVWMPIVLQGKFENFHVGKGFHDFYQMASWWKKIPKWPHEGVLLARFA